MVITFARDRFGTPCCPHGRTNSGARVEFGDGSGVSMGQRASRIVQLLSQPPLTVALKSYLNGVVPPSVALHERRT